MVCCKYTLSLCPVSPSSLYSSCISYSLLLHYSNLYTQKKPACFYYMRGNAESKNINISGKKYENNNTDVAMKTNLKLQIFVWRMFSFWVFFWTFCSFILVCFWDLWEVFSRRCLGVLPSVLTVYSVCQSRSPWIWFSNFDFEVFYFQFWCCSFYWLLFLCTQRRHFALLAFVGPQTLICSKTSVEHSFEKGCPSVWWSLSAWCGWPRWTCCSPSPFFSLQQTRLSWRGRPALNPLSGDIMTSSKELALCCFGKVKMLACFSNRTAYMHYD